MSDNSDARQLDESLRILIDKKLRPIFNESQRLKTHQKLAKEFMKIYDSWFVKGKINIVLDSFIHHVKCVLVCDRNSPFTKRTLDFIVLLFRKIYEFESAKDNKQLERIAAAEARGEFEMDIDCNDEIQNNSDSEDELGQTAFDPNATVIDEKYVLPQSCVEFIICKFILKFIDCDNLNVRTNSAVLLRKILRHLDEIDKLTFDHLVKALQTRSFDRNSRVRVNCVTSFQLLEELDETKVITSTLLFHMQVDPNCFVRAFSIKAITITADTLPPLLMATRDCSKEVCKVAYEKIANCPIESFSVNERIRLIMNGINMEPDVKEVVYNKLVQNWLESFDHDLVLFMKMFSSNNSLEFYDSFLKTYFKRLSTSTKKNGPTKFHEMVFKFKKDYLNENKLPRRDCWKEPAFAVWLEMCQFCKDENITLEKMVQNETDEPEGENSQTISVDLLDEILPDIPIYCDYLEEFYLQFLNDHASDNSTPDENIKSKQLFFRGLLKIATFFTIKDEAQWNRILKLFTKILLNDDLYLILDGYIIPIFAVFESYFDLDHEKLLNLTFDFINRINNPDVNFDSTSQFTGEHHFSTSAVDTMDSQSLQTDPSIGMPFTQTGTQKLNQRIESNIKILERCLEICFAFLYNGKLKIDIPLLNSLVNQLVLKNLACKQSEKVRLLAVKALACFCLGNPDAVKRYLKVFMEIINGEDYREARVVSLKALLDFVCYYGMKILDSVDLSDQDSRNTNGDYLEPQKFSKIFPEMLQEFLREPSAKPEVMKQIPGSRIEYELFETSIEGLCKILLFGRYYLAGDFAQLIIIFQTYRNIKPRMKQLIKRFFYTFKKNSRRLQKLFTLPVNPFVEAYVICYKNLAAEETNNKLLLPRLEKLQDLVVEFMHPEDKKSLILKVMEIFDLITECESIFLHLRLISNLMNFDEFQNDELLDLLKQFQKMKQKYSKNGGQKFKTDKNIKLLNAFIKKIKDWLQKQDYVMIEDVDDNDDVEEEEGEENEEGQEEQNPDGNHEENSDHELDDMSDFE